MMPGEICANILFDFLIHAVLLYFKTTMVCTYIECSNCMYFCFPHELGTFLVRY